MTWKNALLPILAAIGMTPATAQEDIMPLTEPVMLDPSDPSRDEFGELVYRGGVAIEPGEEEIGGLSGLEWHDGQLFAVSDDGHWLSITPDEMGGRLVDILSINRGVLRDERGRRLRNKDKVDAEAIAFVPELGWWVSFERDHRIWQYRDLDGAAEPWSGTNPGMPPLPFEFGELLEPNNGIETIASLPNGMIACAERYRPDEINCMRVDQFGEAAHFQLSPPPELIEHGGVPTGASCASDETCFVLFRSFEPDYGNRAAILRLPPEGEPETLFTLLPPLSTDNFEGLAVREENGRTFLYIVSDDNFSDRQRTLLYKFEIASEEPIESGAPPPGSVPVTEPAQNYETVSVVLETALGNITIALETERAPITAANFLRYVDEDRLDGTAFYRAMRLDREPLPNGLVQGGARWDPERVLPGIPHEPTNVTGLSHTSGALSMAMGEPGTANGDFSIMVRDQIGLDARPDAEDPVWQHGYAVFGYVTDGMDVVEAIHGAPIDPNLGEGWMVGQMLADPVVIIDARRVPVEEVPEASQATDAPPAP